MSINFIEALENKAINKTTNNLYFESNKFPIVSMIEKLFMQDSGIKIESISEDKLDNALESVNAKFIYTNKNFIIDIIHQNDFLVNIRLQNEDTLDEEEKTIMKKLMKQLNDFGFCFYLDNEKETIDFDSVFYDIQKPIKVKSVSKTINNSSNDEIWSKITQRMKELKMDSKTMNRIRVQRWHLINKYGEDYVKYIGEYAEQQFNDYIKANNIVEAQPVIKEENSLIEEKSNDSKNDGWNTINEKMKELNLPFKIINRIRVQKSYLQKKYGENYLPYIQEYFNNQIKDYQKD